MGQGLRNSSQLILETLDTLPKTKDVLYHFEFAFDMNKISEDKVIADETVLRDITLIVADDESDYAGKVFLDNIRFEEKLPKPGTGNEEGENPAPPGTGNKEGEIPAPIRVQLDNELPATATNSFNTLLIGLVFLIVGSGIMYFLRRFKTSRF